MKFTNTGFEAYKIGQLDKKGQYSIVADHTAEANVCLVLPVEKFNNRIIFNGDSSGSKRFVQLTGDTLTFISGCYAIDAGSCQVYKRE